MKTRRSYRLRSARLCAGLTLAEVIVSLAITSISVGGMVSGYLLSVNRAEWTARSAAAEALAKQRIEQTRVAKWDPLAEPAIDELVSSNFPAGVATLDLPTSGPTPVYATNTVSIVTVSEDPPLKMIRVDCTWSLLSRGPFTNTLVTYRSPDQ